MSQTEYQIKQLLDEITVPETGKSSIVLADNITNKVVLFAFASGAGLSEHVAPLAATIQVITGLAELTVGDESIAGKPGTWIQMAPGIRHSIQAQTPVVMLLTLAKQ